MHTDSGNETCMNPTVLGNKTDAPVEAPPQTLAVSRAEKLLVLWLAVTFSLCVFVSLPDVLTELTVPSRRLARSYLRTIGLDQYWKMFVGNDWDIPQLRIIASDASHKETDVTHFMLETDALYRHLMDDRMILLHFRMARSDHRELFDRYAVVLRNRLAPGVSELRFEAVHHTHRLRPTSGTMLPTGVVPLATYRWD